MGNPTTAPTALSSRLALEGKILLPPKHLHSAKKRVPAVFHTTGNSLPAIAYRHKEEDGTPTNQPTAYTTNPTKELEDLLIPR